jgi:L-ascorbate metabolism protein UlaG (beta-lactamase superfamily)
MKRASLLIVLVLLLANCKNENKEKKSEGSKNGENPQMTSEGEAKKNRKKQASEISVMPVEHASFAVQLDEKTFYFDPVGGAEKYSKLPDPDYVFITDIHGDHLNIETLNGIMREGLQFIVPPAVYQKLPEKLKKNATKLENGQTKKMSGIKIKAIPMYNLPQKKDAFHPKGRGNGYVLDTGKKRIYVSGDTEDIPEMKQLDNIDHAFICMNLPYTMPVENAAKAVLTFKPQTVYPYHYRGKNGFSNVDEFKKIVEKQNPSINVELLNWYPNKDEK